MIDVQIKDKKAIQVVETDTGEISLDRPIKTNEELFKLVEWMQRTTKVMKALKEKIDPIVDERIRDNAGEPIIVGDKKLIFKSFQTYRIPPEEVLKAFDDKDQAILVLTEAMRKDAVTEAGLKRLVEEKTIDQKTAEQILSNKEPAGARAYAQVEHHRFDKKGD